MAIRNRKSQNGIKKVFLIPPDTFPIPAVGGGAVQTIITNLLEINEKYGNAIFVVTSPFDKKACKVRYNNSKIYYFKNGILDGFTGVFLHFRWKFYCIAKKLKKTVLSKKKTEPIMNCFIYQCLYIAKKEKADVIVLENIRQNQIESYVPLNEYIGNKNIYYHVHWTHSASFRELQAIPNSISISEYVKNEWIKEAPNLGKNSVLYNCIDVEKFSSHHFARKAKRKELGIEEDVFLVMFCGRFIPVKGINELLNAFEIIENKRIKLLLIGSAKYSSLEETVFSKKIVDRAKRMDNVIYLGYISNDYMPEYYAASDVLAVPSVWQEGAGLVAIEGMASGLPLIITQSGGMVEYVTDECAVKLPIDSELSNNLAKAILELYDAPITRERMGRAGKERARQFSIENYYEGFLNIIENR